MGYTHYWGHKRRFNNAEWSEIKTDVTAILQTAVDEGLQLGCGMGEKPITPSEAFCDDDDPKLGPVLWFNGLGDMGLETFQIHQLRTPAMDYDTWEYKLPRTKDAGGAFCKTARNTYDAAVGAVLCYLESTTEGNVIVSSDGDTQDQEWQDALALAKRALPTKGNILDFPFDVRWEGTFDRSAQYTTYTNSYAIRRRIDGVWLIIKTDNPYQPVARVCAENEERFFTVAKDLFSKIGTSFSGNGAAYDKWQAKKDRVVRQLLTYPELTQDAPESMLA